LEPRHVIKAAVLLLFSLTLACGQQTHTTHAASTQVPIELVGTLEPLRSHFNEQQDLPRAVLLLSPT